MLVEAKHVKEMSSHSHLVGEYDVLESHHDPLKLFRVGVSKPRPASQAWPEVAPDRPGDGCGSSSNALPVARFRQARCYRRRNERV